MNLILHQFKTDLRHFRWRLVVLWLSFAAEPLLATQLVLPGIGQGMARFLIELWQIVFGLALVVSLVQADALVGTSAVWLTRPVRRAHLFWAKTAFIILGLLVPRLLVQTVGWALRGYSPHLELVAAAESLLYSAAILLAVAVLAALTRDLARYFLAVGVTIGGIFLWVMTVDMLVHAGVLPQAVNNGVRGGEWATCAEAVAYLVLAAGGILAWVAQARAGSWRVAVVCFAAGLLAVPVITTVWSKDFLAPLRTSSAPLTLSLVETNRPITEPGELLATELAVAGVPARQFPVLEDIFGTIHIPGDHSTKGQWLPLSTGYPGRLGSVNFSRQSGYFHVIRDFFPADTLWFNENIGYVGVGSAFFNDQNTLKRFANNPSAGSVDGKVTVDLFGVKKAAEAPLRFGTVQALPGLTVTIQKVRLANGVISVSLDECAAQLRFDRDADTVNRANDYNNQSRCAYVLYHPGTGEAFVVSQNNAREYFPSLMSGEAHRSLQLDFPYPALRERLAGVSAADWLREARLCVFVPVYAGTSQLAFHAENYHWPGYGNGNVRQQKEAHNVAQAIEHASLPAAPTAGEIEAYLDKILLNLPMSWSDQLRQTVVDKLAAPGTNGLPALLRRLPLTQNAEDAFIIPAITKIVTRDQLPDLCAALQRDNKLVQVFVAKGWQDDARAGLTAKLSDHREALPADALTIVAGAKDPATYAGLRWHFVRLHSGQEEVIRALEQCPGFDTAAAVREAWQSARLGVINSAGLAIPAAKQGLPDALNLAVRHVDDGRDARNQQKELAQLAALTGYAGSTNDTLPWLTGNLARFQYDAAQQRYTLAP
ncbi:MAG: hypothetical protein P4N60_14670 [Verrucomicrobiae bacterium]|nr:hypothetical protein [Verrucomicrobiae bacterium]